MMVSAPPGPSASNPDRPRPGLRAPLALLDLAFDAALGLLRLVRADAEFAQRAADAVAVGQPGEYRLARDIRVAAAEVGREPRRRDVLPELQARVGGERRLIALAQVSRRRVQPRGHPRVVAQLVVGAARVVAPEPRVVEPGVGAPARL